MAMPYHLLLVRHGESEGNLAHDTERKRKISVYSPEFRKRPGHLWRLTERGVEQAKIAGQWIMENIDLSQHCGFFTSDYTRAKETTGHLSLPGALWKRHPYLHERNWGLLETLPDEEKWKRYKEDMKQREANPFYWRPARGESMVDVMMRVDRVFGTLHREYKDSTVIMVNHGDVTWATLVLIEKINAVRYEEIRIRSKSPFARINNCQIIHYSRVNPNSGEIEKYLNWKRSICPWDLSLSSNIWERIERPVYTNEDLLMEVEQVPRLIHNPCCEIL